MDSQAPWDMNWEQSSSASPWEMDWQHPEGTPGIGTSLLHGILQGGKELGAATGALTKEKPGASQLEGPEAAPVTADDFKNFKFGDIAAKTAYGLGEAAAPMVGAGVGGGLGGLLGVPGGPAGVAAGRTAGAGIGGGLVSGFQALGKIYPEEYQKSGGDADVAFDKALERAKTEGEISGTSFAVFGFGPFKSEIKNLLFQSTVAQPAVAETGHAVQNVEAGKPASEGAGDSYLPSMVGTIVPLGAHRIAKAIIPRGATESSAPDEPFVSPDGTEPPGDIPVQPVERIPPPAMLVTPEGRVGSESQMNDLGLSPDILNAIRGAQERDAMIVPTSKPEAPKQLALPPPVMTENFIGGPDGVRRATTADITPLPESGQISPTLYRAQPPSVPVETQPETGGTYTVTLPNGKNLQAIVTGIKNNRALISTEDGQQLRPLIKATKFMTIPPQLEPNKVEFRPQEKAIPEQVQSQVPQPQIENGQSIIPGAESISDKQLVERKMAEPTLPTVQQKPADEGLFDVAGRGQGDLIDLTKQRAKPVRTKPMSALEYIASKGGIRDEGGDLAAMDANKKFVPGYGKLVRQNGMTLDEAGRALHSADYFGPSDLTERPDVSKVLETIRSGLNGDDTYSDADGSKLQKISDRADEEAYVKDLEQRADRAGIDTKGMTAGQIHDALSEFQALDDGRFKASQPMDRARIVPLKNLNPDHAEVQQQLSDYISKVAGKDVGAKLVRSIQDQNAVHASGAFSPANKLAYIALNDANGVRDLKSLFKTTRHEAIHALKDSGGIPERDWDLLKNRAAKEWVKKYGIDKSYGHLSEEQQHEEAIAEAYADRDNLKDGPVIKRIMQSIADFMEKLKNFFTGGKYVSSEDIFQNIENGNYAPIQAEAEFTSRAANNVMAEQGKTPEQTVDIANVMLQRPIERDQQLFRAKDLDDMNWFERSTSMPRQIAFLYKEAAPYFSNVEKMYERIADYQHQLHDVMKPYFDLSEDQKSSLNKWFEYARLAGVEKYSGPVKNKFTTNRPYYDKEGNLVTPPTLTKVGEVLTLPDNLAKAANAVHAGMNDAMRMLRSLIFEKYGFNGNETVASLRQKLSEVKPSTPERKAEIKNLTQALEMSEKFSAKMAGYTPNSRPGKYGFSVLDKEGRRVAFHTVDNKISSRVWAKATGNPSEGERLMMDLRKKYPASEGYKIGEPMERSFKQDEVEPGLYSLMDAIIGKADLDDASEAKINEARNKIMAEKGFKSHFLQSDNMAGYDTNYQFSIPQYVMGLSHFLGKQKTMGKLEESLRDMQKKPKLYKWGKDHLKYLLGVREEAQSLRFLASQYYLATNPSSMIVNSSQPWLVSLPYMSMFGKGAVFGKELARSYNDFRRMVSSEGIDISKAPPDIKAELLELHKSGNLLPLQLSEYNANAIKDGSIVSPVASKVAGFFGMLIKKSVQMLNDIYSGAEQMNRIVTAIAAIRVFKSDPKLSGKIKNVLQGDELANQDGASSSAANFAKWLNNETHFRYGKMNRSEMMRGSIGATLTQFRSYLFNSMELMYRMARQGKEGRKALFGVYLPMMTAVAGIMGIPAADFLVGMSQYLYNQFADEKKDFKQEMLEAIQDLAPWTKGQVNGYPISYLMMNGIGPAAFGTNLSQRVGLNVGIDPNQKPPDDSLQWLASMSPSTDLIINAPIRALNLAKQDRYLAAFASAMPSFIKNPLTALDWSREGIRTQTGRNIVNPEDVTTSEKVRRAIGFQPAELDKTYKEQAAKGFVKTEDSAFRSQMYSQLAHTLTDIKRAESVDDRQKAQDNYDALIRRIVEYNKTATKPIKAQDIRGGVSSRMTEEALGVAGRKVPKSLVPRYRQIEESYGDTANGQ